MRLSFDANNFVQPVSAPQQLVKQEDQFESVGYVQQACNLISKAVSGLNHFLLQNKTKLALGANF